MSRPLRVLFASQATDAHAGGERSQLALIDALDPSVVEASVVVFGEGSLAERLRERGIATTVVDVGGFEPTPHRIAGRVPSWAGARVVRRSARGLRRALGATGADILHTNGLLTHRLIPFVPRDVAAVASAREVPRTLNHRLQTRVALSRADAVITATEVVGRRSPGRRRYVIPNPVVAPASVPQALARRAVGIPEDAFVVALLAHYLPQKRHLDLVRAVEPLEDVHVVFAGGTLYGPEAAVARRTVDDALASSPARDRIHDAGLVDDVGPIYSAADVVAHCSSFEETFARTVVEAMLASRPIVATRNGAPSELVDDGCTGLLYDAGDVGALRAHLVRLRRHPSVRTKLARAALQAAGDRFAPERHAREVVAVYEAAHRRRQELRPGRGRAEPA